VKGKFWLIRIFSKFHGGLYRFSRGRIATKIGNLQIIMLTTTGRKSGKKRVVPLASIPTGKEYMIIASYGGNSLHPAWFLNLRENPNIEIQIGTRITKAKAAIVEKADDRYQQLWQKATNIYHGFDNYQKATSRNIPIVIIKPC
jgi:deazaflavin-dependent oxidoreductase (nitroreductase family)